MGKRIIEFFTRENTSLAQKSVELLFGGLVVAGLAIFLTWWIESTIELFQKRRAVERIRNAQIEQVINVVSRAYTPPLDCALRARTLKRDTRCPDELAKLRASLLAKKEVLHSLAPSADLSALDQLNEHTQRLEEAARDSTESNDFKKLVASYSSALTDVIQSLAGEFSR